MSADPVQENPPGVRIDPAPYDGAAARALVDQVQQEYVVRYGGPDETPVDPADFRPPRGLFVIARGIDGTPLACGGWRSRGDAAEIKRMYVVPRARRRGLAVAVLRALEHTARDGGHRRVELVTGTAQPEAMAMYRRCGYRPIPGFGPYAEMSDARFFGKMLCADAGPRVGDGGVSRARPCRP